jgi:predicted O-linked N-acetylglucosamine transferase (SPINDLY family)
MSETTQEITQEMKSFKMESSQLTLDNLTERVKSVQDLYDSAQNDFLTQGQMSVEINKKYEKTLQNATKIIKFIDSLNPFQVQRIKDQVKVVYYINAEILIRIVGMHMNRSAFTDQEKNILYTAISHLQKCLNAEPFNARAKELYKVVFIYLTIFNSNAKENIELLRNVLKVDPSDYQLQYNLGFMYHRANNLEESLSHYKLALGIIDLHLQNQNVSNSDLKTALIQFKVKCLNGLGAIYFAIQDRDLANYFFFKGLEIAPDDPDLNNQVGVVFTELRITDKAIEHYNRGIQNAEKAHISTDIDMLKASMHMNMGLAYCYEINYPKAIECYNMALKYKPRLSLAYQNKLLDMNYISHLIEDPMYISNLHKNINKIYPYVENDYRVSLPNYKKKDDSEKLNIGFVSGDFICHPVSYFLNSIFKNIDYDKFNVHCYSLKVVNISDSFPKCKFTLVKGTSPEELKKIIENDNIDILFDMSSQTGDNRLDTFVLKPAPIQISYCGYPNTSGLSNMDYHIVDHFTDSDGVTPGPGGVVRPSTQKYYSEKLLFMKHSFLNYTSSLGDRIENLPILIDTQPATKNGYLTVGSFNRYNKINDDVIRVWEKMLEECPNVQFIIKTKEFLTEKLKEQFLATWKNKSLLDRIKIIDYSDTYDVHLLDYNLMDISLDSFPYSGTTTSCEALLMGVPVLTLFDNKNQFHSCNVSSSLMINSGLPEYVTFSEDEYINKIRYYSTHLDELKDLKKTVRDKFMNGHVCDYLGFVKEFEEMLTSTYKIHKW